MSRKKDHKSRDTAVIYEQEGYWVAHSLRTDQVGVGDRIVDALADLIIATHQVCDLAAEDDTIACFREAPAKIQRMAAQAKPLPGEIYEVAHKMATGEWPEGWEPPTPTKDGRKKYRTEVSKETAGC